jgi:hypothetical protein
LLFLIIVMTWLIDEKIYEISLLFNIIFLFLPFWLGIIGSFTCLFSLFFYKKRKTYFGILWLYFAVLILASSFLVLLLLH